MPNSKVPLYFACKFPLKFLLSKFLTKTWLFVSIGPFHPIFVKFNRFISYDMHILIKKKKRKQNREENNHVCWTKNQGPIAFMQPNSKNASPSHLRCLPLCKQLMRGRHIPHV